MGHKHYSIHVDAWQGMRDCRNSMGAAAEAWSGHLIVDLSGWSKIYDFLDAVGIQTMAPKVANDCQNIDPWTQMHERWTKRNSKKKTNWLQGRVLVWTLGLPKRLPLQPQRNTSSPSTSPISAADPPGVCQQSAVVWQVIHVVAVANGALSAGRTKNFLYNVYNVIFSVLGTQCTHLKPAGDGFGSDSNDSSPFFLAQDACCDCEAKPQ